MIRSLLLVIGLIVCSAAVTAAEYPRVLVKTNLGELTFELYPAKAPRTVENFLQYVNDGFYAGTLFHRVVPDFVAQGGGLTFDYVRKQTRAAIINESDNGLQNRRGSVAMARTGEPDSATAQFYINLADNLHLDDAADGIADGYTVFGRVIKGMNVVDSMVELVKKEERSADDFIQIISTSVIPSTP